MTHSQETPKNTSNCILTPLPLPLTALGFPNSGTPKFALRDLHFPLLGQLGEGGFGSGGLF